MVANTISFNVQQHSARERSGGSIAIKTHRIKLLHQTSRCMLQSALVPMLLMLPSTRAPPLLPVNWSLQHSLTLVKKLYHSCTVHTPPMSWGKFFSITVSYAGTESHFRAHIAWWCAGSNQPLGIVKDWQFKILMKTGCPRTSIPSPLTIARDVKLVFERAREWLDKILRVHFLHPVAHCCWYYDF